MSTYSEYFPLRFINTSGETIPAYAVMQISGWEDKDELGFLKVKKPDGEGKIYILNGTRPVASNKTGRATSALNRMGAFALFDDAETPEVDEQWGPEDDEWHLKKGGEGFFIIGDVKGIAASAPGSPVSPSTKRVRVSGVAGGGGDVIGSISITNVVEGDTIINNIEGGGSIGDLLAQVKGTVPGSSGAACGLLALTATNGAFLVYLDGTPVLNQDDEQVVLSVANPDVHKFIGGTDGILTAGFLSRHPSDGKTYFVLPRVNVASETGWDKTKDQSKGHDKDKLAEWQDDDKCDTSTIVAS